MRVALAEDNVGDDIAGLAGARPCFAAALPSITSTTVRPPFPAPLALYGLLGRAGLAAVDDEGLGHFCLLFIAAMRFSFARRIRRAYSSATVPGRGAKPAAYHVGSG